MDCAHPRRAGFDAGLAHVHYAAIFGKLILLIALLLMEGKGPMDGRRTVLAGCAAACLGLKWKERRKGVGI